MPPEYVSTGPVLRVLVAERVELIDQNATMLIKGLLRDVLRLGTGRCNVVRNRWILNTPQRTFSSESLRKANSRKMYGVHETVSGPPTSLIRGPQAWLAEPRLHSVLGSILGILRN